MKRAAIWLAVAVVIAVSVDVLGDLTQNRPDERVPGSRSEVVVEIRERSVYTSPFDAARRLWAICEGTVHNKAVAPGIVHLGGDLFQVTMEPAVGEHSWRRLKGCLEDLTVDQVLGEVVRKSDIRPEGA